MHILNICPFYTVPPDNGGKTRIYKINEYLSTRHKHTITQFSTNMYRYLGKVRTGSWTSRVTERYTEYVYSPPHFPVITAASNYARVPPLLHLNRLLSIYAPRIVKDAMKSCDVIVVEEPFQFDWVKKSARKPIIADSQNVEYILTSHPGAQPPPKSAPGWQRRLFEMEKRYALQSDLLLCASQEDADDFKRLFGVEMSKVRVIPNGVDIVEFKIVTSTQREAMKKKLGLKGFVAFFVGGLHPPNKEALQFLYDISEKLRDVTFLIAGAIGDHEPPRDRFIFTKGGTHEQMIPYFKAADVALNPIFSGSGTNVKLLQYLASGLPTISSTFGTRGIDINQKGVMVCETKDEYIEAIQWLKADAKKSNALAKAARSIIIGKYDFASIAKKVDACYKELI